MTCPTRTIYAGIIYKTQNQTSTYANSLVVFRLFKVERMNRVIDYLLECLPTATRLGELCGEVNFFSLLIRSFTGVSLR